MIVFCLRYHTVEPFVLAAINSAARVNPKHDILIAADKTTQALYRERINAKWVLLDDLLPNMAWEKAIRVAKALLVDEHGGWFLDTDTISLYPLPDPEGLVYANNPTLPCAGVFGAPPDTPLLKQWIKEMRKAHRWSHWIDEELFQKLVLFNHKTKRLGTEYLHYPSNRGYYGPWETNEDQVRWIDENAYVLHYFSKGAFGVPYKNMNTEQLAEAASYGGYIPRLILANSQ